LVKGRSLPAEGEFFCIPSKDFLRREFLHLADLKESGLFSQGEGAGNTLLFKNQIKQRGVVCVFWQNQAGNGCVIGDRRRKVTAAETADYLIAAIFAGEHIRWVENT
jgi:hypothetical protein